MTDHPLTEDRAAEMWDASPCPEGYEFRGMLTVEQDATVYAMRAAFDMGREYERTNPDVDARPWEPLNGRKPRVGDEVRQDRPGMTITAVVGRVDEVGDPWATGGNFIGRIDFGTWYVRRHIQELPTKLGTFIVANGGHEYITATVDGVTYHAREAVFTQGEVWQGVWRSADGFLTAVRPEHITPGPWKVDDQ